MDIGLAFSYRDFMHVEPWVTGCARRRLQLMAPEAIMDWAGLRLRKLAPKLKSCPYHKIPSPSENFLLKISILTENASEPANQVVVGKGFPEPGAGPCV
jgi:hypothetical protein